MEETHTMRTSSGLECTIQGGDESMLRRVVERMEKGTLTTPDGGSVLHMAAASGTIEDCERFLLFPMKCDVNGADDMGETPLFKAIYERRWETVHFLIEKGADVTWRAKSGETPLHIAAKRGTKDIVELLISKGSDLHAISYYGTPLYVAAASGNSNTMECLLELKADANPTNSSLDSTPIFHATINQSIECLDLLLKAGADPNRASYLSTPLRLTTSQYDEGIMMCLLKAGADPNMLDPVGHKPIEYAAWDGCREAVELLFPVTSCITCYPDWSVDGIMLHAKSKQGRALFQSKEKKICMLAKAKGEEALKKSPVNYFDAYGWYSQAHCVDHTDTEILSNLSLCHAMMYNGEDALKYAKDCIVLKPRWAKAHFREGVALNVLKDFKNAAKSFIKARALDPRDKEIIKELRAVRAELFNRKH